MADDEFEVDYIDGERVQDGSHQFHVHWKGFPDTEASWEPRSNLRCQAKVEEYMRWRRKQQEREQADERRRRKSEHEQQLRERSRRLFSDRPPGVRCAPVVPAATGRRIRISVKRNDELPIATQKAARTIDFPRRNIAETRFSSDRDYEELFQGVDADHVPVAIIGRRSTADGKSEYEVKLGDSTAEPIWVAHDIAVKLCPSLVTRYVFGTIAAKLGLLD
jgi:hypothetical protein